MGSDGLLRDEDFAFAPEGVGFHDAVPRDRSCSAYVQTVENSKVNLITKSSAPKALLAGGVPDQLLTTESSLASPSLEPTLFQTAGSTRSYNKLEHFLVPASAFLASGPEAAPSAAPASKSLRDLSRQGPLCATGLIAAAMSSHTSFSRHIQPQPQPNSAPRRLPAPSHHPTASARPGRGPEQALSAPERVMPWPWSHSQSGRPNSLPQSFLAWSQPQLHPQPQPQQQQQQQQQQQRSSTSVPAFASQASTAAESCMHAPLGSFGADIALDEDLMAELDAAPWPPFLTSLAGGNTRSLTLPPRADTSSVCTAAAAAILGMTLQEVPAALAAAAATTTAAPAMPPEPPEPAPLAQQPVGAPSTRSSAQSPSAVLQADGPGMRRSSNVARKMDGQGASPSPAEAAAAAAMTASTLIEAETEGTRAGGPVALRAAARGGSRGAAAASSSLTAIGDDTGDGTGFAGALNSARSGPSLESLRAVFELSALEAARALGISMTDLKRRCRALGIRRWPQRKLISLNRLAESMEEDMDLGVEERPTVLDQVANNPAWTPGNPNTELD